jgi:NADH-quinone oxidoreductase subunit M
VARIFFGPPAETGANGVSQKGDLGWGERLPALILLAALLFIGFWPRSIAGPLNDALNAVIVAGS